MKSLFVHPPTGELREIVVPFSIVPHRGFDDAYAPVRGKAIEAVMRLVEADPLVYLWQGRAGCAEQYRYHTGLDATGLTDDAIAGALFAGRMKKAIGSSEGDFGCSASVFAWAPDVEAAMAAHHRVRNAPGFEFGGRPIWRLFVESALRGVKNARR